jgi:hypothetical protein
MLNIVCENCGKRMKVPPSVTGKQGKCPRCGNAVAIPPQLPLGDGNEQVPANPPDVRTVVSPGGVEEERGVVSTANGGQRTAVGSRPILTWIIALSTLVMACCSIVLVVGVVQVVSRLSALQTAIANRPQVDID